MEETAVEFLESQYKFHGELYETVIEQAKKMEEKQKHKSIDKQVGILKNTLEELMINFDSEEDRLDFILDICNGYRKRINL